MPIVETLESYSRALLPLRAFVRRPFQVVAESFRLYGPRIAEVHRQIETVLLGTPFVLFDNSAASSVVPPAGGLSSAAESAGAATPPLSAPNVVGQGSRIMFTQPSLLNYITSSYALLMFFVIPAFYLLIKAMLVTGALLVADNPFLPFNWPEAFQTKMSIPSVLFLCLSAMGTSYITDTFLANIQNAGTGEQNFNMLEMSVMFHFTPHGKNILLVAFIQVCQLLSLQVAGLFPRGRHYRLAITSFWGMLDMAHFARSIYRRPNTYPSLQLLTCMPEAMVILTILISLCVHGLTYLVTGGNVRRRIFEQRALPTGEDEYGIAVFKLGRACLEATRGVSFWNEVDAVVIPFGTILDKRRVRIATMSSNAGGATGTSSSSPSSSTATTLPLPTIGLGQRLWTATFQHPSMPSVPLEGFSNEVADIVEQPGHRQHISRRQTRLNNMRAFTQSTLQLLDDAYSAIYNKVIPARFQRQRRRIVVRPIATTMSVQEYLQLRMTIEAAMEQAGRPASPEAQQDDDDDDDDGRQQGELSLAGGLRMRRRWPQQEEDEENIYSRFLEDTFSDGDDEDFSDGEFAPPPEQQEDEGDSDVESGSQEMQSYLTDQQVFPEQQDDDDMYHNEDEEDEEEENGTIAVQRSALGSLQDFLLDSSFLSIFLSGQGRDTPLTRSQHRRAVDDTRWDSDATSDDVEEGVAAAAAQSGRGSQGVTSIRSRRSRIAQHRHSSGTSLQQPIADQQNAELLSILQKYRKTTTSLTAGPADASVMPSTSASTSSPAEIMSAQGSSSTSPPPMADLPANPEDSSFYSRLLCVIELINL
ncbi:hypothetical protein DFQ27_004569 [Actinomortierella ambigua]|uniref:Uncharacterized protein n=1 Tax=Actinomortierella ambigua TaxID=1343610 RepID=A0A9P6UCE9_9FUNG|nr:hypothetical protein DFQ27_004569 [Actinomortierella ambigua]